MSGSGQTGGSLGPEADGELLSKLFAFLYASQAPYEQFFFDWRGGRLSAERAKRSPAAPHYAREDFALLRGLIEAREPLSTHNLDHPYFARERPRSMLIDEMEAIWAPIAERDDWGLFHEALGEIEDMRQAYS